MQDVSPTNKNKDVIQLTLCSSIHNDWSQPPTSLAFLSVSQTGVLSLRAIPGKNPAIHLSGYAWCHLDWSQSSTRYVDNSKKSQLYTYKACESPPSHFHVLILKSILRRTSYTLSLWEQAFAFPHFVILKIYFRNLSWIQSNIRS